MTEQLKEPTEARQDILQNQVIGMCVYTDIILYICISLTKHSKKLYWQKTKIFCARHFLLLSQQRTQTVNLDMDLSWLATTSKSRITVITGVISCELLHSISEQNFRRYFDHLLGRDQRQDDCL